MPETPNIYNFDLDKNKADDLPLTTFAFLKRSIGEGGAMSTHAVFGPLDKPPAGEIQKHILREKAKAV